MAEVESGAEVHFEVQAEALPSEIDHGAGLLVNVQSLDAYCLSFMPSITLRPLRFLVEKV